jgi:hypothetical protein
MKSSVKVIPCSYYKPRSPYNSFRALNEICITQSKLQMFKKVNPTSDERCNPSSSVRLSLGLSDGNGAVRIEPILEDLSAPVVKVWRS